MSSRAIVGELQKRDYNTFKGLNRTTIDGWIDRSGSKPWWSDTALERARLGNDRSNPNAGQKGVLVSNLALHKVNKGSNITQANYPLVVNAIKDQLKSLRLGNAPLTVVTVRGIFIATIIHMEPEILQKQHQDGSTFRASESFVRKWLHGTMAWSRRKATQAAQKQPENWEDLCERSVFRKAYAIKEEDIPPELFVNSDQTQGLFAPGDKMTWTDTGAKQVPLFGGDEKRAFTALVSVSSNGKLLPVQAIYTGKSDRSCPSRNAPHYHDLMKTGCLLEASGTTTYWSNQETMRSFVNKILAPYFDKEKIALHLPPSQKALWSIDVWSVHRSNEFRNWMKKMHPTIILDFIPGGCTGVAQPCDVGIQRPWKLSIKRSYHEDIVSEIVDQLKDKARTKDEPIRLDNRLGTLRDRSVKWLWNAHRTINNPSLVKKVIQYCLAEPGKC